MSNRDLVLDTHVWIWLINGDTTLEPRSQSDIAAVVAAGGRLLVSVISVWEVGMLESRGRLAFTQPCLQWVNAALSVPGITMVPLTPEIAVESSRLPGVCHGDPADRILIATTRLEGAVLATRDQRIIDYGEQGHVSVLQI